MRAISTALRLAAVGMALPLAAQAPVPKDPTRQAQVLALLQRIPVDHAQLYSTPTVVRTNGHGCTVIAPALAGLCGNGWEPAFDPALARHLARDLAAIYGVTTVADAPAPAGQPARLDAFDATARIGLKLRGVVVDKPLPTGGAWPTVVDEPAASDLDATEQAALRAAGISVHTVDVADFWVAGSRDRLTTTLCYLASVATFLNGATDGEDVDLGAVTGGGTWLRFGAPAARAGLTVETFGGGAILLAARATEVAFAIEPARAIDPTTERPIRPIANAGRAVVATLLGLSVEHGRSDHPGSFRLRLLQADPAGRERELASSDHAWLFVPGAFDGSRPFRLVLALQAGAYRVPDSLWVSRPADAKPARRTAAAFEYPTDNYLVGLRGAGNFGTLITRKDSPFAGTHHLAEDVWLPAGTPVRAVADGIVRYSDFSPSWKDQAGRIHWNLGNVIVVEHALDPAVDGLTHVCSVYVHLGAARKVAVGDVVAKGQVLGAIGRDRSEENGLYPAHLHFGLHVGPYFQVSPSWQRRLEEEARTTGIGFGPTQIHGEIDVTQQGDDSVLVTSRADGTKFILSLLVGSTAPENKPADVMGWCSGYGDQRTIDEWRQPSQWIGEQMRGAAKTDRTPPPPKK